METANLERDAFRQQKRVAGSQERVCIDIDASRTTPACFSSRNADAGTSVSTMETRFCSRNVKQSVETNGETHNTPNISNMESGVFYKRFTNLLNDINKTQQSVILNFRVPPKYKLLYDMLTREEKKIVKEVLLKTIEGLAMNEEAHRGKEQTMIVNLNINVAEARVSTAETRSDDIDLLREKLKVAEERAKDYKELMEYYKKKSKNLEERFGNAKQLIEILEQSIARRNLAQALKIITQMRKLLR